MRIVIDLQGVQGESRSRGIGRYSLSLAQAMVRNRGDHEIIIALNGMFSDSIEPIRAAFDGLLPQENIRVWQAVAPVSPIYSENDWRRKSAELLREAFLLSLLPDVVHITSLFEGYGDDAVHSIGLMPESIPTAVTFYDLIPLIQSEVYLKPNPTYEKFYLDKLEYLKSANLYLAISESSLNEAIEYLNVRPESVANIGAAIDDHFKPTKISVKNKGTLYKRFGLTRSFVMYSGATDERKNHLRLIKAFSLIPIALRKNFQLAIVGKLPLEHAEKFQKYAKFCGLDSAELVITNRVSDYEMVALYNLCAVFVFPSLYEGFGLPALEAMSCGTAVIAANTTSLPEVIGRYDALFDPLDEASICKKLVEVLTNENFRNELKRHGIEQAKKFSWNKCAINAIEALERLHACSNLTHTYRTNLSSNLESSYSLVEKIAAIENPPITEDDWIVLAKCIAQNQTSSSKKQLLVDISELVHRDAKSGIQRVVRSVLAELLSNPPMGFSIEPVYANQHETGYRYARQFIQKFMKTSVVVRDDDVVDTAVGDVFIGLDLQHHVVLHQTEFYAALRRGGVQVYFVVYDLLPVLQPHVFPAGTAEMHSRWLTTLAQSDGVVCISRAVADEMFEWLKVFGPNRLRPLKLGCFHLGADVAGSLPSKGLPDDSSHVLKTLLSRPTFLLVGTIEPRKGQLQTLAAFEILWQQGIDVNIVFVGKHGWNVDTLVQLLRGHAERNRRLFWLEGVSDEYLEKVYAASTCLIAASEGEGFGLPLIEAAQHKLPIIARDIPVFREVAGEHAFYFSGAIPNALADGVREWLVLDKACQAPQSFCMPWLTWKQSTENLLSALVGDIWYKDWMPDGVHRFPGSDHRLGTQVGNRAVYDISCTGKSGYLIFGPYISLEAGCYVFTIRGEIGAGGAQGAHMDVVVNQGDNPLGAVIIGKSVVLDSLASLKLAIDKPCTDLEVRVWVNANSDLRISLMEITPCKDEDSPLLLDDFGLKLQSLDHPTVPSLTNRGNHHITNKLVYQTQADEIKNDARVAINDIEYIEKK